MDRRPMKTLAAAEIGPARDLTAVGTPQRTPLCGLLVDSGKLEPSDVDRALRLQREQDSWERIGLILVKLGLVSDNDVAASLSDQLGIGLVDRSEYPDEFNGDTTITERFLVKNRLIVLDEDDENLTVAMADPQDDYLVDALRLASGKTVLPRIGVPSEIEAALDQLCNKSQDPASSGANSAQFLDDVEQLKELAGEAPVIKLVNQLIHKAAESGASDIHIEPFEGQLKVRYRVDGLLREVDAPPLQSAAAVISRVKIMANLNIAERRLAQDGRFKQRVRGEEYDLRISTVPTMHGESVVMRLLKRNAVAMDFGSLGFDKQQQKTMKDILATPHGILLVTGPTGSGKSTTLYAALEHLNEPERMIITVEDPVEYNIKGINQMQVKPQIGLTFANALRSIVRQDPDVIMIGEMRDTETAEIAVQSALTGHLVLSTLHTNDAPGSVMRLLDMGVQDYLLTSAVVGIQAQRLVRTLCTECREAFEPIDEIVDRWRLDRFARNGKPLLYRPHGCDACGDTGYSGRIAIIEILLMSDEIRELVLKRSDVGDIARVAERQGMVTMRDDGLKKAVAGLTTIEEVLRVTPAAREDGTE
jgi:general secretion pathway protein E